MWPLVRQARHLGRYREITQVLVGHGFGYLVEQLGLASLLSLPRRMLLRAPPSPPISSAVRLRQALVELGPTFVKLGQVLSTRPDMLPPDFVAELDKLQDTVPPFAADLAIKTIEEELGRPLDVLFAEFCREPLAAASLGQAHAAVLHNGDHVVVKVQRPDIAARVAVDLAIIVDLAHLAQERMPFGNQYDLVELAWEFSSTLRAELDYRREGHHAEEFRGNFAGNERVYIPRIYWDYTAVRVLTSERIYGIKINDVKGLARAGINQALLARHALEVIVHEIFVDGYFHADPHPGNFFALSGARVGVVDFGQVGILDQETTRQMLLLLIALGDHDPNAALRALERLGALPHRSITPLLRRDMQRFMGIFVDRSLSELSARETFDELLALMRRHQLRLPGPLATLIKALVMMEGVGMSLDPHLDVFGIARPYAQKALAEQLSPAAVGERLAENGRQVGEVAVGLPQQFADLLGRANDGELFLQTREMELRRVSTALLRASSRIAVALVLSALILVLGMLTVAIGFGNVTGWLPITIIMLALLGILLSGTLLLLALFRSTDR
jgi:ubiquinone biosynthesis protein